MEGTLQTILNLSPVTGISPSRSRNRKFNPSQLIFSGNRSFGANISKSLLPREFRSVIGTIAIRNSTRSDQGNGGLNQPGGQLRLPMFSVSAEPLLNFVASNFLPLALVGGVALGLANPSLGCFAHRYHVSKFSAFGIFFISGLTLRSEEIGAAAEAWPVGLYGLLAGGNSALALAMTVISSLLGILIVPFSISKLIAGGVGASVPADQLFKSLVVTLLIPLIFGKVSRESFKGVADFSDSNRKLLSNLNALLLSMVPWIQVSRSRPLLLAVKPAVFLVAVVMGALLHLILLIFNALSIQILCSVSGGSKSVFAKKENACALLLVASQKTLPVLIAVVEQLGGIFGESGLLVLPCVAAHLNQIIMDSFFVSFWNKKEQSVSNAKMA
ncbi:hypothetical protein R6Q57_021702 [Mikania cordata]